MNKLTVFANFSIDSEERFLRLKDSFFSFSKGNIDNWVINIRGNFKEQVKIFLTAHINTKVDIFFNESENGWCADTLNLIPYIKNKVIFFWIEDHICIKDINYFNNLVDQIYKYNIDYLLYSFFHQGKLLTNTKFIDCVSLNHFCYFDYNETNYNKLDLLYKKENIAHDYLISAASFLSLDLFKKNISISEKKFKYNSKLPFNFERSFFEKEILPFRNAILNEELFVSIDDDHGEKGYSLISRGQYPNRISRNKMLEIRSKNYKIYSSGLFLRFKKWLVYKLFSK